ncbi:MAG: hypothetical protein ACRDPB_10795, partial [Nocardioidaceae bacterium]
VELVRASLEAGSSDNVTCVVADVVDTEAEETPLTSGPIVVGSAAEQPRRAGAVSRSFFRGHRGGDTGELEPVPGDPADARDPEELRYAPQPPRRFLWFRRIAALLVVIAILVVAGVFGYRWTQDQYYVAASASHVTIFRGVAADVPGLRMHRVAKRTNVTMQSLGDYPAERVRNGIDANSYQDAVNIVRRLTNLARKCPPPAPSPTPSPTRAASGKASRGASPSGSASASPTGRHTRRHQHASSSPKPTKRNGSASAHPSSAPSSTATPSPTVKPPNCIAGASR